MHYPKLNEQFMARRMAHPGAGPLPVILDTDTANEIDDQFALTWALLSKDAIDLQAIHIAPYHNERSSSPADGEAKSYNEARRVLDALGENAIPVMRGSQRYLATRSEPVDSEAARDLVARAMARPVDGPPLYVATIGCLTNVASAILMEPKIIERIVLVMLAGNDFDWPDAKEFNLVQDISAGMVIFGSGVPIIHLPAVRIAMTLGLSHSEVKEHVRGCGAIGNLLADCYEQQCDLTPGYRRPIWDLAPIAWLINEGWAPTEWCARPTLSADGFWVKNHFGQMIRKAVFLNTSAIYIDLFRKLASLRA